MPAFNFITEEQHESALQQLREEFMGLLQAYVTTQEEWLTTEQALKASGVKTRQTLVTYARATAPGKDEPGRISYKKLGRKCRYLRSSCINYAQRKLGQPALRP